MTKNWDCGKNDFLFGLFIIAGNGFRRRDHCFACDICDLTISTEDDKPDVFALTRQKSSDPDNLANQFGEVIATVDEEFASEERTEKVEQTKR